VPTGPCKEVTEDFRAVWPPEVREFRERFGAQVAEEVAERVALGREIATARTERRLSQKELARLAGVQQADISRIERGAANPTISTLTRITRALGLGLSLTERPARTR